MIINTISETANQKGQAYVRPSDDQLKELGLSLKMWNKFYYKRKDPSLNQLAKIAEFMDVDIRDLLKSSNVQ